MKQLFYTLYSFIIIAMLVITMPVISAEQQTDETAKSSPKKATDIKPAANKTDGNVSSQRSKLTIAQPLNTLDLTKQDIKHFLKPSEIKTFLSGPTDILTLVEPSTTAINRGVAILLPNWEEKATDPKAINALRLSLPQQGWTTLTIQPPEKPKNLPMLLDNSEESEKQYNKIITEYEKTLSTYYKKVMEQARNFPGLIIVIAQGNNGGLLMDILTQQNSLQPSALILLSSFRATNKLNTLFAKQIAQTDLPILDLWLNHDHPLVMSHIKQRQQQVTKTLKVQYRQTQLSAFRSGYYPVPALQKAIIGWLNSIGW